MRTRSHRPRRPALPLPLAPRRPRRASLCAIRALATALALALLGCGGDATPPKAQAGEATSDPIAVRDARAAFMPGS